MISIQQQVIPRHRAGHSFALGRTRAGSWRARRTGGRAGQHFRLWGQQGSITHSTITVTVGLIALVGLSVLGFVYLQQVFGTASQGVDIHALEQEVDQLQERQRQLELEGAELRSIQAVEDRVHELNLVPSENVAYLAPLSNQVAIHIVSE